MKKLISIFAIIMILGLFLPSAAYACGSASQKSCCEKKTSSKEQKKDCCKNKQSQEKNNSCGGKCGHSNCTSSTASFNLISINEINFKNNNLDFSPEKSKFFHSETFISSGFSTVWLPPKIK
jgi:hypothetical protein